MGFILALSPILLVLIGIVVFKMPAMKISPIALVFAVFLAFTYFKTDELVFKELVGVYDGLLWKGIKEGFKIVMLVFSSFLLLNLMQKTGAMRQVQNTLATLTSDRRAQLIIIGLFVPIFLEGAAGAGSPAAIAAPFLVGLGFDPMTAIVIALMGDATPCSWGGAGLTTITGGAYLVEQGISTTFLNSAMVGRIHMFGVLVMPFLMTFVAFGRKGFKGIVPYLTFAGVSCGLTMFFISNFIGPEITSLGTGFLSILFSVAYLKIVKIKTPDEFKRDASDFAEEGESKRYSPIRALSPYLVMMVLLPLVRYTVPFSVLTTFGYVVWVDVVLFICAVIGAVILGVNYYVFMDTFKETVIRVTPVMVTMASLLTVSYIMQSSHTGMITLVATTIANASGFFYPAAAVLIGSVGSFVTGTGLGSNIMFAPMHIDAASMLDLNPITVFAGQNAGGSLGNMICPNNTVAVCATVGVIGQEGEVMKRTLSVFVVILALYMALTMLYTHVMFPLFGM